MQTFPQIESVQFYVIPEVGRGCFCCVKAFGLSAFLKHLFHQQFFEIGSVSQSTGVVTDVFIIQKGMGRWLWGS